MVGRLRCLSVTQASCCSCSCVSPIPWVWLNLLTCLYYRGSVGRVCPRIDYRKYFSFLPPFALSLALREASCCIVNWPTERSKWQGLLTMDSNQWGSAKSCVGKLGWKFPSWNVCSHSWHLDCSLVRDPAPAVPIGTMKWWILVVLSQWVLR